MPGADRGFAGAPGRQFDRGPRQSPLGDGVTTQIVCQGPGQRAGVEAAGRAPPAPQREPWLNLGLRFSRQATTPSRASGWWSATAVRAAMSSQAWAKVSSAAL